ncbi:WD40 repeat domain-containing protein [Microcoleus sp. S13_C5]|uniref:WD40 repeat domain-containing protein n=1 Tax=Microcoleus sp. S13_C5 TaxID=3055411 RepID=UPI002FD71258
MSEFKQELGEMSREKRLYTLETLPRHLVESGQGEKLHQLLTDFDFIEAKLDELGVQALIEDYDLAIDSNLLREQEQSRNLYLIPYAIRKLAPIVERDKTQLAGQLLGRLLAFENPEFQRMLEQAKQSKNSPWLRPLRGNLVALPLVICGLNLGGHNLSVQAVAIAPDGKRAISASYDKTLKIWDTDTGIELRTLTGHTGPVRGVAIAPDSLTAISASDDNTLKIWDTETGRELQTLTGHAGPVRGVAIAPDGLTAISASDDNTLKIWDLASGSELRTLTGHTNSVRQVAIAPDSLTAISASDDNTLKVWNLLRGTELRTLTYTGYVSAVAMAPDGFIAISVPQINTLKIWDTDSTRELQILTEDFSLVQAVAIAPDGKRLISASSDMTLRIWDLASGKEIASFTGDNWFDCCAIAPDGVTVVAGGLPGRVHFLRLEGVSGGG